MNQDRYHAATLTADPALRSLLEEELAMDRGAGDATTLALVPPEAVTEGRIVARAPCTLAGGPLAALVFQLQDPELVCEPLASDGDLVPAGTSVMSLSGRAAAILTAERTALNIFQRLTGVATLTRAFVERAGDRPVRVLDTRKTTPGLRLAEKYAVRCGGGHNHRMGLHDRVMIKDNHVAFWKRQGGGSSLGEAVARARERYPDLEVEVEIDRADQLDEALSGSPDWLLLDNMACDELRQCVERCTGRCRTEASGGVSLETIAGIAATGVDAISVGALTHSAPAADLSLELAHG